MAGAVCEETTGETDSSGVVEPAYDLVEETI